MNTHAPEPFRPLWFYSDEKTGALQGEFVREDAAHLYFVRVLPCNEDDIISVSGWIDKSDATNWLPDSFFDYPEFAKKVLTGEKEHEVRDALLYELCEREHFQLEGVLQFFRPQHHGNADLNDPEVAARYGLRAEIDGGETHFVDIDNGNGVNVFDNPCDIVEHALLNSDGAMDLINAKVAFTTPTENVTPDYERVLNKTLKELDTAAREAQLTL